MLPNFNLDPEGKLSERLVKKGIKTYLDAVKYIHNLPYGRPIRPANYWTIIHEGKGTCSSKHAYLKALAEENSIHSIELRLCIYPMDNDNTPGVGPILKKYDLPFLLEVHTYLYYDGERFDITFPHVYDKSWEEHILVETDIDADQIGDYKKEYHKAVLKDWKKRDNVGYPLDTLWSIREECIAALG